jgi:hypothetical protein
VAYQRPLIYCLSHADLNASIVNWLCSLDLSVAFLDPLVTSKQIHCRHKTADLIDDPSPPPRQESNGIAFDITSRVVCDQAGVLYLDRISSITSTRFAECLIWSEDTYEQSGHECIKMNVYEQACFGDLRVSVCMGNTDQHRSKPSSLVL